MKHVIKKIAKRMKKERRNCKMCQNNLNTVGGDAVRYKYSACIIEYFPTNIKQQ
jgi:hypothetical protein